MAANLKGEVPFEADGASYRLVFTIDSLCALEDRLNLSVEEIGERMSSKPRISFLRAVFHAGLREHHPLFTEKEAGEIFQAIGFEKTGALIGQAFTAAFAGPEAKDVQGPQEAAPKAA